MPARCRLREATPALTTVTTANSAENARATPSTPAAVGSVCPRRRDAWPSADRAAATDGGTPPRGAGRTRSRGTARRGPGHRTGAPGRSCRDGRMHRSRSSPAASPPAHPDTPRTALPRRGTRGRSLRQRSTMVGSKSGPGNRLRDARSTTTIAAAARASSPATSAACTHRSRVDTRAARTATRAMGTHAAIARPGKVSLLIRCQTSDHSSELRHGARHLEHDVYVLAHRLAGNERLSGSDK